MWRPWAKSSPKFSDNTTNNTNNNINNNNNIIINNNNNNNNFRCSSFKDIENLCEDYYTPTTSIKKHQPSTLFHRVYTVNSLLRQWPKPTTRSNPAQPTTQPTTQPKQQSPETRIVVYYTSLRIVRPTFEACRAVMSILHGFQLNIDERDLAMDLGFMSELRELLRLKLSETLTLPRVFIGGRYIGGAEEVKNLHEIGELKKLISGFPPKRNGTCDTCGGYRFILCGDCNGSHKIFSEKVGFRSCLVCNENGLIRCPNCYQPPLLRPILT
ncbi:hypothetical protein BVRB_7g175360 [Beta vulgaris subsp. vulgaris]|nr:hypothetical protein BVRB_7g175360 [Beta vulgaris subsp. vulgaris]